MTLFGLGLVALALVAALFVHPAFLLTACCVILVDIVIQRWG